MAQRIKKQINIFEFFFIAFIILLFLILANKYLWQGFRYHALKKINHLAQKIEWEEAYKKNIIYNKNKQNKRHYNIKYASLEKENDKWLLTNIKNYYVTYSPNNNIIVYNKFRQNFQICLSDIKCYHSQWGKVVLDIQVDKNYFKIYEQEDAIPILGYHYILDDNKKIQNKNLEIHKSDFEKQIDFLTNKLGCRWFTFADIMENYVLQNKKIPEKACIINFDDGKKSSYNIAFPILKKYGAVATFYIITDMLEKPAYMTWNEIDELYQANNEIGSHTLFGGSLVHTNWFVKKMHRNFTDYDLFNQIQLSKKKLENRGYIVKTFAYPLGEWNEKIENYVKNAGYIAARDITREPETLGGKTPTVSFAKNFIWHMHYYKPELKTLDELKNDLSYTNWWQFEDSYKILSHNLIEKQNSVRELSGLKNLSFNTYHVLDLRSKDDKIAYKFIVANNGTFILEFFGSVKKKNDFIAPEISVWVDDKKTKIQSIDKNTCKKFKKHYYCSYYFNPIYLQKGIHILKIKNNNINFVRLDKFRIFRLFFIKDKYDIKIIEY